MKDEPAWIELRASFVIFCGVPALTVIQAIKGKLRPMEFPNVVIGSGPAGVSCAVALLAQGQRVLMIDAGNDLEPEKQAKLAELQNVPHKEWWGPKGAWLREGMESSVEGIPLKLAYGSDFPYRTAQGAPTVDGTGVNTKYSLGKGGFSAVWGSAIMPYRPHDLAGWPITFNDLAPHYAAVTGFMPVSQEEDGLTSDFPMFAATQAMPLSAQAAALETKLKAHERALHAKGVTFGRSRLAVNSRGVGAPGPCVRCGLCMYGCPYGLIYSTAQTVDAMKADPNFAYAPGFVVTRVEERGQQVVIQATGRAGEPETFTAERAFVGAGVLASTALMLRSLEAFERAVTLKESHYFLLPMLRLRQVPGFERGALHTLAQMFFEILDERLSPHTIHLQTYTYNDLFEQPILQKLGPAKHVFPLTAFLSRLFLFQGYLHSDHSALTQATLTRNGHEDALTLVAQERPETTAILKRMIAKLGGIRKLTGLFPLSPLMRRGEPGRGFHTGCSFPMQTQPSGLESDLIGRPAGLRRIHVVDSSVFPSVPATTITYTVMANAHRIGTLAAQGVQA